MSRIILTCPSCNHKQGSHPVMQGPSKDGKPGEVVKLALQKCCMCSAELSDINSRRIDAEVTIQEPSVEVGYHNLLKVG